MTGHRVLQVLAARRTVVTMDEQVLRNFLAEDAALRRYLVDDQFLTREGGVYWRSGGTFEV